MSDQEPAVQPPRRPRWVIVAAAGIAILILIAIAVMLIGGDHGPSRHGPQHGSLGTFPASPS